MKPASSYHDSHPDWHQPQQQVLVNTNASNHRCPHYTGLDTVTAVTDDIRAHRMDDALYFSEQCNQLLPIKFFFNLTLNEIVSM